MEQNYHSIGNLFLEDLPCMDIILPFRIGQEVRIGDLDATIIGITIRSRGYALYECGWMNNGERRIGNFDESEICSKSSREEFRVGFKI